MKIARRDLFVGFEELEKLLGLPDGVEIEEIKKDSYGWTIKLISAGEVFLGDTKVTIIQDREMDYRRIGLATLEKLNKENINIKINASDFLYANKKDAIDIKNSDITSISHVLYDCGELEKKENDND
ncbi:hypothetical protein JDW21_18725 [Bacillus subtilis]|uniref:Uncharacterized protein n=1 Tax=Bacillus phage vB_BsuS_PJN02 TaxID=2920374 RepID=A0AC61TRN7_9CAUD|nr:hypothetical protein [Bacillus subtilis]YP_010681628.1 hypothetical protein PQE76_gp010 [Bacillus phage vB_BsuS_PJN02]UNH58353.1 hypothetical protein [Bacillus phage vB_BsuS_PJN02]WOF32867.1 hypothetical protein OEJ84_23495 [Bacillus subtilis]